jgi:arylsulfatase A-like enzyme/cytochrome c-type biogenesis protein CcmH/NrfG
MAARKGVVRSILLAAVAFAAFGCGGEATTSPAKRGRAPDVVLITIDTLRADRLGCYGHAAARTPTLDGVAKRGARFEVAVAHTPLTAPSHASVLTGLTPLAHGVRDNGAYVLPRAVRTLAEDFHEAGYRTAAFVSGFPLKRRFGFDRGFDSYDDHLPRGKDARRTAYVERTADRTTDAALAWLRSPEQGEPPVFLWVHYFDPHAPYEAPAEAMLGAASPYDGEIAFVDTQLGRLLRALDERRPAAPPLLLVTADHGESLGEHGEDTHGIFVYDATIRVPLMLSGPGVSEGVVVPTVARAIDVAPTLLDYAGLRPRTMQGRSLRRAVAGERLADEPAYSESLHAQLQYGWAPLHAWRTAKHKLIEAPRVELYDLAQDANERDDRSAREPERALAMRRELQRAMAVDTPNAEQAMDPGTRERLAALGYVGTGGGSSPRPTGRDPKDGIGLVTRLGRNGMTIARTEPQKAIRELTALLAEDPGMLVVLRTRAVAYAAAGRHRDAVRDLRELEKRGALSAEDAVVLGDNLRQAGDEAQATLVLEKTIRENPTFAQPLLSLAAVHVRRKDLAAAEAAYARVLALEPENAEALRGIADVALVQGDADKAGRHYARILELDAADVGALSKLGVVKMRSGQKDEAIGLLRRAVDRDAKNAEALLYLAGALAASGRPAEAVPFFERALAVGPRTTMTLNGLALTRIELGDRRGAAAAFRESLRLDPDQPDVERRLRSLGGP